MIHRLASLLVVMTLAATLLAADQPDPKILASKDGTIQIKLPEGWESTVLKGAAGKIHAKCAEKTAFVLIISESKTDLNHKSVEEYAKTVLELEGEKTALTERKVSEPTSLKINGADAVRYEVTGKSKNVNLVYHKTFIETKGHWNQIMCWTLPSHVKDAQPDFEAICESFRENQK